MSPFLKAALLGAATGGRSATGVAALALRPGTGPLTTPWGRRITVALAVGELIADKTPFVPSRLSPPALIGRVVAGAAGGATLGRRAGISPLAPALIAAAATVLGSVAGAQWRGYAAARGWNSVAAALLEDAATVALATVATR